MVDATRYGADFQQPDDDGDHTPLRDLCRKAADGLTIIVEHEGEYTRQQVTPTSLIRWACTSDANGNVIP